MPAACYVSSLLDLRVTFLLLYDPHTYATLELHRLPPSPIRSITMVVPTYEYVPKCSTKDVKELLQSLHFPEPESITFPASEGVLHQIVLLQWPEQTLKDLLITRDVVLRSDDSSTSLVLRIAGREMPHVKNENEAAALIWVASNTSIPVPRIICHDSTTENSLHEEYMIMTYAKGVEGSKLYPTLTEESMTYVLDQLADHTMQLYRAPFNHMGGLKTSSDSQIVPGPAVDETQWTVPDIEKYWPTTITFTDLNPTSPTGYPSLTEYITAYMNCYIRAISAHPALQSLPYLSYSNVQMLKSFVQAISEPHLAEEINDTIYVLAHRDLHFGNMLLDPDTARITAILDWEFAGAVAFPLWQTCFLWNGDTTVSWSEDVRAERAKLRQRWNSRVDLLDGGQEMLAQSVWKHKSQEAAWDVMTYMRCIVEVIPRGTQLDDAKTWWGEIVHALQVLGVGTKDEGPQMKVSTTASLGSSINVEDGPDAELEANAMKELEEHSSPKKPISLAMHNILVAKPFT